MAKAKSSSKKSSSKRPAKEPIVEVEAVEPTEAVTFEAPEMPPIDPTPNLQYTADPDYPEPPSRVRIGMKVIELPEAAKQREGFYSEHARKLSRTIKAYKEIQPKGK
jgi:hypothetical protein